MLIPSHSVTGRERRRRCLSVWRQKEGRQVDRRRRVSARVSQRISIKAALMAWISLAPVIASLCFQGREWERGATDERRRRLRGTRADEKRRGKRGSGIKEQTTRDARRSCMRVTHTHAHTQASELMLLLRRGFRKSILPTTAAQLRLHARREWKEGRVGEEEQQ